MAIQQMMMEQQAAQQQAQAEQMKAQEAQRAQVIKGLSDKVRAQNLIKQITEQNLAAQLQEVA